MPARNVQALQWHAAVESIVTPLVRALRAEGVSQADILDLLRDVAERAARKGRAAPAVGSANPALSYAAGTRLIGRWRSDPAFSDHGVPRPLALRGPRSFAALARAAKVDASIAHMALRRLGLIRMAAGRVVLRIQAYVPAGGVTEKLDILGRDGAEFIRTMLHNVRARPGRAFLQRKTSYDNIGGEGIPRILAALRQQGTEMLMSADALLAKADRDRNPAARGGRRTRVSFGVYCFSEPVPGDSTARKKRSTSRRRTS